MKYFLSEIAQIVHAQKNIILSNSIINAIYIDSRQISIPQNALFIALYTNKDDGHKYIIDAYNKGIRNFLVQYLHQDFIFEDANYVLVNDTLDALQNLATYHRQQFKIPVIGITGSNGKTIVKEWLYFLLKEHYNICRSPRSFNSQIGVPLSVLNLNSMHSLGIFEAGISLPKEMKTLENIIRPDIGILTHFGTAHSEGFIDDEHKLKEKLKLFQRTARAIVQRLHHPFLQKKIFEKNIFSISENKNDFFYVKEILVHPQHTQINMCVQDVTYTFQIPYKDDASIKNAITCFASVYTLNKNILTDILPKFSDLPIISLRQELRRARFQSLLINDYYNSDIDSFEAAVSQFNQYTHYANKVLILSDFEEIKNNHEIYQKAIQIIHQQALSYLILIGKEWNQYTQHLSIPYKHYSTTADFLQNIHTHTSEFFNAIILLKAARKFEFEKIANVLEQKTHDTVLEINIPALWHNLSYYKNLIGKNVKMMCMLKASGYGSGSIEMAYALQKFGVNYIAVAYTDEGVELKQANIPIPIMVMLPEKNSFNDIIQYQLEPEIYSFEILEDFVKALEKQGIQNFPVHIKLDTGMHRLGFLPHQVQELIASIKDNPYIKIKSIFSHLAASENKNHDDYTYHQINTFKELTEKIKQHFNYPIMLHICNSAAISRFPQAHFDMIRLGIGMYGISDNINEQKNLQNVLTLKTKIVQIKHLKEGDSIGYGRNAVLNKDNKIAVIPIGYADGFSRKLGNENFSVKWKNQFVSTIGNVCMDMTMLNMGDMDARVGDEIIIFSNAEEIKKMSMQCGTIPYEILTSLSQRVKRVYVYE